MPCNCSSQRDDTISTDQTRQHEETETRNEDGLHATSHTIHWKRKDDIAESLPTIGTQVIAGIDKVGIQIIQDVENR